MTQPTVPPPVVTTLFTLAVGAAGAGLAVVLRMPAALLMGPALMVALASLTGAPFELDTRVRDVCFVVLGLGIGAGFDPQAGRALMTWPVAFLILAAALTLMLWASRALLVRFFGFDRRGGLLAGVPGHLSLVLSLASDSGDVARIAVVQSVRLLVLTVSVPFLAVALGYHVAPMALPGSGRMSLLHLVLIAGLGGLAGIGFRRLGWPAPLLLGPLSVSAAGQMSGLTPGALPDWAMIPAFIGLGTLIGSRFSGMSAALLMASLGAGVVSTLATVSIAALAAVPVAALLHMPLPHVLVAFAPGGLETMVALGVSMGASPGFVAAAHLVRLLVLGALIPLFLGRRRPA